MRFVLWALAAVSVAGAVKGNGYLYTRIGNAADSGVKPAAGYFLAGGGTDLDEGFRWLCGKANGGDFLILRAAGDDAYNAYVRGLCPALNSVATLVVSSREGARDAFVADAVRHAEALFIAGGDQANYLNYWQGSTLQDAMNASIARGTPVGGTSAGVDVMGEFVYSALRDTVTSAQALGDPFHERVTLARHFLKIPVLAGVITDAHVAARDRMGRDVVFLARIAAQDWTGEAKGIFIDEKTAVLVEADGKATVAGAGSAYFVRGPGKPENCAPGEPLTFHHLAVYRVSKGGGFQVLLWSGTGGTEYAYDVEKGVLKSTQAGGGIY